MKMIVIFAMFVAVHASILSAVPFSSPTAPGITASSPDEDLLQRFLRSNEPPLTSYRARRTLTASSMGGRMAASVEAWTLLDSSGRFDFEVIRAEGSGLVRNRVLLAALETEQRSHNQRTNVNAELTPANYNFEVRGVTGDTATIALQPRRRNAMLLIGSVVVRRDDGDMLRIDGSPSENPSWWTRRVDIVRRYSRIDGVRVPVEMSSRADVRLAGDSSFLMTYEYTVINGRPVRKDDGSEP